MNLRSNRLIRCSLLYFKVLPKDVQVISGLQADGEQTLMIQGKELQVKYAELRYIYISGGHIVYIIVYIQLCIQCIYIYIRWLQIHSLLPSMNQYNTKPNNQYTEKTTFNNSSANVL